MKKKKTTKKKVVKKKTVEKNTQPIRSAEKKVAQDTAQKKTPPDVVPMPTAGHKVTEFEDRLDSSLLTAEEQPKRGRGRPRKEAEQPPPEIDVKIIGQAIQIPFDIWALKNDCDALKISIEEAVLIAKPAKILVDHYLPQVPDIAWAWFSLITVTYTIVYGRLVLIAEIKKANSSSEEQMDAARGNKAPQGQGGPHPSASFPSFEEITKPVM